MVRNTNRLTYSHNKVFYLKTIHSQLFPNYIREQYYCGCLGAGTVREVLGVFLLPRLQDVTVMLHHLL